MYTDADNNRRVVHLEGGQALCHCAITSSTRSSSATKPFRWRNTRCFPQWNHPGDEEGREPGRTAAALGRPSSPQPTAPLLVCWGMPLATHNCHGTRALPSIKRSQINHLGCPPMLTCLDVWMSTSASDGIRRDQHVSVDLTDSLSARGSHAGSHAGCQNRRNRVKLYSFGLTV